mgnify:CR=1 FL=1
MTNKTLSQFIEELGNILEESHEIRSVATDRSCNTTLITDDIGVSITNIPARIFCYKSPRHFQPAGRRYNIPETIKDAGLDYYFCGYSPQEACNHISNDIWIDVNNPRTLLVCLDQIDTPEVYYQLLIFTPEGLSPRGYWKIVND